MSAAAVPSAGARPAAAALSDRFLAALPLLALFTWLALVHAWQAWLVPSPWLFSDELEHTQLARSLAETGETLRRGSPYPMSSLWVALAAPAWLIDDVQTAYGVVKFTSAIVMTSVVFPAYALARLIAGPWASLFAAAAAGAIPAFMYSGLMLQEPLAYPFATLCLYVFVRALAAPTYRWVLGALALALVAGRVRPQLAILLGVLLLAGAVVWLRSERGRRLRARLSTWDKVGAGLLLVGLAIVGNEWMSHRSEPWQQTTRYWKHRMVDYALDAGGALTIGIGILPVVAGLALVAVALVRGETPAVRAFAAVAAATIVVFAFYTGLKAAWLSTHAFGRIPERNLIYLAPLFFAATAYWMSRGRLHAAAVGAAAAFAAVLLVQTPYELGYPYFEAPGFSILALANRHLAWDAPTIQRWLLVALAVAVVLVLGSRALVRRPRAYGAVAAVAAVLVVAWNVTGSATAQAGSREQGAFLLSGYTTPVDWVDRATGGERALFLGQQIEDPNQLHLLEFWNRSVQAMWSLDGTAKGPGPTLTPDLESTTGRLYPDPGMDYAVVQAGIDVVGRVVAERPGLAVVEVDHPLRLGHAVTGIFQDGWAQPRSAYSQYETPGGRGGTIVVGVARLGCGNDTLRATAHVTVGRLVVGPDKQPAIGAVTAERAVPVACREQHELKLPAPPPPFRVEVVVDPPFVPAEADPERSTDYRTLGAQVAYRFV
ncbi:MAG TPA: glycosyltransferase family 39 protein, partial [Gaiellaceae bacterium]|nr:glycosyltransferase family 39 protein [Gaiellaceae bacterium]